MKHIFNVLILSALYNVESASMNAGLKETEVQIEERTCQPGDSNVCLTKGCVRAASEMLNKMDDTVDPCDNFFEFSCGSFLKNVHIPEDKKRENSFNIINDALLQKLRTVIEQTVTQTDSGPIKMAKQFYASCMNTDLLEKRGIQPVKDIHSKVGGWPVVEGSTWDPTIFNWAETIYMNRKLGLLHNSMFKFDVRTDVKNSTKRTIWLDQTKLGLSREFLVRGLNDSDVEAYLQFSTDAAILFGADPSYAKSQMQDVLNFEIELAKISMPREERRNKTKLYNLYSLKDLQQKIPEIPFLTYINTMLGPSVQVTKDEIVVVSNITFFQGLSKLIEITAPRTLSNYLLWRIVKSSANHASEDLRGIETEFLRKTTGIARRPPRWRDCIKNTNNMLPYAVSHLYITHFFNEEAKSQTIELVTYLKNEFGRILDNLDWMDNETKIEAKKKLSAIRSKMAYPDELKSADTLMSYYQDLKITNDSLLENVLRVSIHDKNYAFSQLREPVDKNDWRRFGKVAVVNAYYRATENSIIFPAGILQGNFFEPDRPKYLNFGGIGFVIGHEITHGFDDQGKQFDELGNLRNWWKPETDGQFLSKTKCMINQYSNYVSPENGLSLDGVNTQGENIADNGGLKEAYGAYREWSKQNPREKGLPGLMEYSPNQLLWISQAQVWCSKWRVEALKSRILTGYHSPGRFRVLGPNSNSPEFSADWNCPINSTMNPSLKCAVW